MKDLATAMFVVLIIIAAGITIAEWSDAPVQPRAQSSTSTARSTPVLALPQSTSTPAATSSSPAQVGTPIQNSSPTESGFGNAGLATYVSLSPASPANSVSSSRSAWATYLDPEGLYSLQYPTDQGRLYVTTSTADPNDPATDLVIEGMDSGSGDNSLDLNIMPNDPSLEAYEHANAGLVLQGDLSENGITGQIYRESDNGAMIVFLSATAPDVTSTFYLNFNHVEMGLTPNDAPLPAYWREILDSFRIVLGS